MLPSPSPNCTIVDRPRLEARLGGGRMEFLFSILLLFSLNVESREPVESEDASCLLCFFTFLSRMDSKKL